MEYFKNIILNVPHSSIANYNEGWTGKMNLFNLAKKNTDWHADLIFNSRNPRVIMHKFPFSQLYIDVDWPTETDQFGKGILYTYYFGHNRHLQPIERDYLMGIYGDYMDDICRDLTDDSLLITCETFTPSRHRPYDVGISFNDYDGSRPSFDTLDCIAETFRNHGYRTDLVQSTPVITPKCPASYRSIRISVSKRKYMDANTLLLTDGFKQVYTTINEVYGNLLRT